ncbi:MAG: phage tail protein [Anaerolineae bacterium]|nr:phage tail protein [Anaerolineae bacterium]
MDANGLRFWMLADERDWTLVETVEYDERMLRLQSRRKLPPLTNAASLASEPESLRRLELVPETIDEYGTRAQWSEGMAAVVGVGVLPNPTPIYLPSAAPTDLALGYDGVLYMAIDGAIVMQDRRDRWEEITLRVEGFAAWRLAAAPDGGVWALDRTNRQLARVTGLPYPTRPYGPYGPDVFRPCDENPNPPHMIVLALASWPAEERAAGIACSPVGEVALLTWGTDGQGRVRLLTEDGMFRPPIRLAEAYHPYSLQWVSEEALAVLVVDLPTEAPVFEVHTTRTSLDPVGDFYPIRRHDGGPLLNGISLPPHYPTLEGSSPLYPLSLPSYATQGSAINQRLMDSGSGNTAWHRLYLEAVIPPQCAIRVWLAASDDPRETVPAEDWHIHVFGDEQRPGFPHGVWVTYPSEVPFHQGLLACPIEPHRAGLFTVLIQRSNRKVRTLHGRFLRVWVELVGDGRTTPEIAALRAYASRFSYVSHYLPELYHEDTFPPDADEGILISPNDLNSPIIDLVPSTAPDFLERFIDNFEGILTPLEDRIAAAYLLTDPRSTPEDALDWLGSWIGVSFDPSIPEARRRKMIQKAPILFKKRGTLDGLKMALDIATGGISGGEIVLLEDFKLRRTFATILGADFADEDDPLLVGVVRSGNAYVGDTLFLGDENQKEFLTLYRADLPVTPQEQAVLEEFFDRLAHRITVLVHEGYAPQDLALIRRVVELEIPAHVTAQVFSVTRGFIIGMAALVGVDTYLIEDEPPGPVEVGRSTIGLRDLIQHPATLDPRLAGGPSVDAPDVALPIANLRGAGTVERGEPVILDGRDSRAPAGRQITEYQWTQVEND